MVTKAKSDSKKAQKHILGAAVYGATFCGAKFGKQAQSGCVRFDDHKFAQNLSIDIVHLGANNVLSAFANRMWSRKQSSTAKKHIGKCLGDGGFVTTNLRKIYQ